MIVYHQNGQVVAQNRSWNLTRLVFWMMRSGAPRRRSAKRSPHHSVCARSAVAHPAVVHPVDCHHVLLLPVAVAGVSARRRSKPRWRCCRSRGGSRAEPRVARCQLWRPRSVASHAKDQSCHWYGPFGDSTCGGCQSPSPVRLTSTATATASTSWSATPVPPHQLGRLEAPCWRSWPAFFLARYTLKKGGTVRIHTGRGPPGRAISTLIGPADLEQRRRHRQPHRPPQPHRQPLPLLRHRPHRPFPHNYKDCRAPTVHYSPR
jgi:hypothetical protein